MLGQLYDGFSELGLGVLFCRLALFAVAMILSIVSAFLLIMFSCFSKDIEHLLLFPVRPCDIFTGKYITVILFCYGIEILLLLPVCIIQTQYMGETSAIITYISAAAILPHIVVFPLAVLVTICLKFAMLLKRMRTLLVVTGIIVYFAGGVISVLLLNGQTGAERDLLNWLMILLYHSRSIISISVFIRIKAALHHTCRCVYRRILLFESSCDRKEICHL